MGSDLILTGWQCDFLSLFFLFRYLNAIQTMCPHILRYLTTAVITNKDVRKRRQVLKDLVKVIQQVKTEEFVWRRSLWRHQPVNRHVCFVFFLLQESYTYKDPITEFVECLYVNFDFDSAQRKLRECESVRRTVFYLYFEKKMWNNNVKMVLRNPESSGQIIFTVIVSENCS